MAGAGEAESPRRIVLVLLVPVAHVLGLGLGPMHGIGGACSVKKLSKKPRNHVAQTWPEDGVAAPVIAPLVVVDPGEPLDTYFFIELTSVI